MKTKETRSRAVIYTKTGKVLKVWLSAEASFTANDLTDKVVWRFPRRGVFASGVIFVQGGSIDYVEAEYIVRK